MADLTYRLVLRATFEGREQLDQAVQELEKIQFQGAKVGVSVQQGGARAGEGLQGIARSAMSIGFMFNMVESAWMRQTMASIMAANAQDRYNSAVARFGVKSEEAQRAARQLTQEMQYLDAANMRANVSMGLMAGTLLISTDLLKKESWATIASTASKTYHTIATKLNTIATGENILTKIAHKAVTIASTAIEWLENAALQAQIILRGTLSMGLLVPAMIVGAAAAAGIAGYSMGQSKQEGGHIPQTGMYLLHEGEYVLPKTNMGTSIQTTSLETSKVEVFSIQSDIHVETDLERALTIQNKKIVSEWKRMRP